LTDKEIKVSKIIPACKFCKQPMGEIEYGWDSPYCIKCEEEIYDAWVDGIEYANAEEEDIEVE